MGKGDGKKKRSKKTSSGTSGTAAAASGGGSSSSRNSSSAATSSSSSSSSSSSPMRVTTNSLIPVRRQLLYAKLNKEFFKQASSAGFRQKPALRTKYRRTWDEEELELKAEERKRKGQDPDWQVILSRGTSGVQPLVIVDGYNIIYQWKRLKKHMVKGDLSQARQLLIDDLENLRVIKGWRIEVVFDGRKRSVIGPLGHGPASVISSSSSSSSSTSSAGSTTILGQQVSRSDREAQASLSKLGVRVVFSGVGMEADTYIESRCVHAKNVTNGALTGSFIVATDDAMIRLAACSAGALCMSADRFVNELKAVKETVSYRVEAAVAKVNGHSIRPEKLRGMAPVRFGRGSVVIEDKRANRTTMKQRKEQEQIRLHAHAVTIDKDSIVDFSLVPNRTKPFGQL
jgi:predicted RNA-binding protein with PIN domain